MTALPSSTITVETLPVIAYQGVRVLTTELLAQLYGTDDKNIHMNFANNVDRFVAGKHFFKLEGEELKEFKRLSCPNDIGSPLISPFARNLTLWTERGAARHAKILDTDAAWDVFERLENAYFNPRESAPEPTANTLNPANFSRLQLIELAMQAEQERLALESTVAIIQPKAEALDLIATGTEGSLNITETAKTLQINPKMLFQWLSGHKWIYRRVGGSGWVAYQDKIQSGLLEHKITTVKREDGSEKMTEQVRVTAKGLTKLAGIFSPNTGDAA